MAAGAQWRQHGSNWRKTWQRGMAALNSNINGIWQQQ